MKYTFVSIQRIKEHRHVEDSTYLCESGLVRTATFTEVLILLETDLEVDPHQVLVSLGHTPFHNGCGHARLIRFRPNVASGGWSYGRNLVSAEKGIHPL